MDPQGTPELIATCYRWAILKIDQDHGRFRQIVRGKVRENLRKYISTGELVGRKGKDVVSIPIPQIDIPRFKFGEKQTGGVGQGDGNPSVRGEGQYGNNYFIDGVSTRDPATA